MALECVFFDLDGTALTSEHTVTPRLLAAWRRALAMGVRLVCATGRSHHSAVGGLGKEALSVVSEYPGVYSQGLVVFGPGGREDVVYEKLLDKEVVRRVLELKRCHPRGGDFSPIFYARDEMLGTTDCKLGRIIANFQEKYPVWLGTDFSTFHAEPINKIVVICKDATLQKELRPEFEGIFGEAVDTTSGLDYVFELLPRGCSKGDGVVKLAERLEINLARSMAIGDGENDIVMLRAVGVSYSMGNANELVRAAAQRHARSCDEDGLAIALEEVLAERAAGKKLGELPHMPLTSNAAAGA